NTNSPVAGSPYTIGVTNGTLTGTNYDFQFVTGQLTVTQAVLSVTADNKSRVYGAANPPLTAAYSGFANGEDQSVLSGAPALSTTAISTSPAGPYPITVTGGSLGAANYSFNFVNGTLTVGRATLTVSANNISRAYGALNPVFTVSYTGFLNSDDANVLSGTPAL